MIDIRSFREADWPPVREIYQQGIDTKNATFQTKAKSWPEWNSSLLPICRLVAVVDGKVVGWAGLSAVSSRAVYAGVAEVSIYIAPSHSGRGIGRQLLLALITRSEQTEFWTLQATIFPENTSSISLHEKCGFRIVGRRERLGQIDGVWRDVLLLERRSHVVGL